MDYSAPAMAFLVGLLSGLHCLGMCGGIAGVLTLSLPGETRRDRSLLLLHVIALNIGRIGTYAAAGLVAGVFGGGLLNTLGPGLGAYLLKGVGAAILFGVGLYMAGWFPALAFIEAVGLPLWRRLEPLGHRLLPPRGPFQALLFGVIWGFLPCGLTYSLLAWTVSIGEGAGGMLTMAAFGAGTLPAVLGAGMVSRRTATLARMPWPRRAVGSAIMAVAVGSLVFAGGIGDMIFVYLGIEP